MEDWWSSSGLSGAIACWPLDFQKEYKTAYGRQAKAQVAIRRIDHFIATNGAE